MCYNISAIKKLKKLEERFDAELAEGETISEHYYLNGFNHPKVAVISSVTPNFIHSYHWGLIPSFCKTVKDANEMRTKTLNAKSETIFALPSFKNSIRQKRCLVLTDGFYEWRTIGKLKYPYFIQMKNKEAFAFGGIFNDWVNKETGEIINTFSIITTEANPLMAKIHNVKLRMPLILPRELEKEWLNPNLNETEIADLMNPFDENQMQGHTISKLITNRNENPDKPEIQQPFEYPELAMYD
jgi:putative SOS response-associated peptidase YedK